MKRPVFTEAEIVYADVPDSEYDMEVLGDRVTKVYIAQLEQYADFLERRAEELKSHINKHLQAMWDLTNHE